MGKKPYVVVDWGTSSFRLWGLSGDDEVLGKRSAASGMSTLQPNEYLGVLEENISALEIDAECSVVVCGMAGAAQGWHEAPYMETLGSLFTLAKHVVRVPNIQRVVHILPGVKQLNPANVMRGEETQLLGLLHTQADFNGVVCLPGTHTKWVQMKEGNIHQFTTHMSGELFALLSEHSVLKHSVQAECEWDQSSFEEALRESMEQPERLVEQLFSLRASSLLENVSAVNSRSRLSGLLMGVELAATRHYWDGCDVALIGDDTLCENYSSALTTLGVNTLRFDAEMLTLNGLTYAYHQIQSTY